MHQRHYLAERRKAQTASRPVTTVPSQEPHMGNVVSVLPTLDVEDLLAKRGVVVSHETIRQWCRKFGPRYARALVRTSPIFNETKLPVFAYMLK